MTEIVSFGEWVRRRRKALDLTQAAVAARVGCAVSMVRKIEADERRPSRQIATLLGAVLDLSQEEQELFRRVARAELRPDVLEYPVAPRPQIIVREPDRHRSALVRPAAGSSPILTLQFLGGFHVAYDDGSMLDTGAMRAQSLLAYLALHRGIAHTRQHLAFTFWPDSDETQAYNNLRQALYQLRHALPDADRFLSASATTLCWRVDSPYRLDVADFERALADEH